MWHELLAALCLVMVVEGILPFLSPVTWRNMMIAAVQQNNRSLRIMGLMSMLMGIGLLYWVNG